MKLLTSVQLAKLDLLTIQNEPISSVDLMERAALACFHRLKSLKQDTPIVILVGPGNNGGDGLAIARLLIESNYSISIIDVLPKAKKSADFIINKKRLLEQTKPFCYEMYTGNDIKIDENAIIIDAIFGTGLNRELDGDTAKLISTVNQAKATTYSIDIPSGLFADNSKSKFAIQASKTFTFQFPKISFLFAENYKYTGKIEILDIRLHKQSINSLHSQLFFTEAQHINLPKRDPFNHKGNFGHGLLIAGAKGKMGACMLSAKACLRSGIGLLSAFIPYEGATALHSYVPECMVISDSDNDFISNLPETSSYTAVAIGPGIGLAEKTQLGFIRMISQQESKLILDADALNIIAKNKDLLERLPSNTILTPHPKEFDRMFGLHSSGYDRFKTQQKMSQKFKLIIVLKGRYTSISFPNGEVHFNTTGNPGMATAGSGDVLTGILLAFIAKGMDEKQAAITSVFIHGLAGDFAKKEIGEECLMARDIINNLPKAFMSIQ